MYVATVQHLNNKGQVPKTCKLQYISDTSVTLKQSQGHQSYNGNVDP